ncbi:MAG: cobalamin B12-binding domain-containing protein [Hyphomicrobiales bacterium]|nr:cobalamin B12-binding domain-containing protein [Hyphomicrobiales bacterium]
MGQGRISFSGGFIDSCDYRAGNGGSSGFPGNGMQPGEGATILAEALAGKRAPEVTDDWMLESVARKHARLLQVSTQQRERIAEFVELLFDEESDGCQERMEQAFHETGDTQKVVDLLLEPAARIIGENWCADECDFLKVTIAMSRMQRLFRRMACEHPPASIPDLSRCALLTPAPGEQHTFGLSVVDDAFRRAGWEVDCCGCDEEAEMFRLVGLNNYQILGVSVSVERLLPDLAAISRKLRARSRNKSIVLIAGGSMVMQNPQGAIDAGFDLLAVDAVSAVTLAEAVIASLMTAVDQRVAAE